MIPGYIVGFALISLGVIILLSSISTKLDLILEKLERIK